MKYSNGVNLTTLDGRALRHLDARQKGCLGANVLAQPGLFRPTVNQLAVLLHVSATYIAAARLLSPAKRAAILAGHDKSSFVPLLNPPQARLALPKPKAIDDVMLTDIIRSAGLERTLTAAVAVETASNGHAA